MRLIHSLAVDHDDDVIYFVVFHYMTGCGYITIYPFYHGGYLGGFQYLVNMSKAVMNILTDVLVDVYT